jgi:putative membrane protein
MFEGHYFGMHILWWFVWIILLIWIFLLPLGIPNSKSRKDNPTDILKRRFAKGEIDQKEYQDRLKVLQNDNLKNGD